MLARIEREVFDRMDDESIIFVCFKPLILSYKEISSVNGDLGEFYRKMTSGQQALFVFSTYHNHVIQSEEELYWWSAFFMAQGARWEVLKEKMLELGDLEFVAFLQDVEVMLRSRNHPIMSADFACVSRGDLDLDSELRDYFRSAYKQLAQVTIRTIAILAASIRRSPDSFVTFS